MRGEPGHGETDGPLAGGNMNAVVREGDTVVRRAGPWTPTVHRFLNFLQQAGVDWIPRPVAVEVTVSGARRERLSFVHGQVPHYPLPDWVWDDRVLTEGARRLRQLHDCSTGFGLDSAEWQSPSKVPAEVICHNDFAPHNLVFDGGRVVGAIDFDFCSPGPRVWDLAYFATRAVPLTADPPPGAPGIQSARARVGTILDAYGSGHGAAAITWESILRVAIIRLHDLADMSRSKAAELSNPQLGIDADSYDRDGAYLASLQR